MPTPIVGALALAGVAGSPVRGTVIRPAAGVLSATGVQSALRPVTLAPSTGTLVFAGQLGSSPRRTPAAGALGLSSQAGTIVQGIRQPSVGALSLASVAGSAVRGTVARPAAGTLALAGISGALRQASVCRPGTVALGLVASQPAWPDVPQQTAAVVPLAPGQFFPTRFTVDSSLDLPADQYTADVTGSALYQLAHETDRITLRTGDGGPIIEEGGIDEYTVTVEPTTITGSIKGRDQMARLLDTQVSQIYQNGPPPEVISGAITVPIAYGLFLASSIAAQVVQRAGLALSWECPDYFIHDSFNAVGRPIDVLLQLVRPFSLREARKVDVFLAGRTVYCRQRSLPMPAAPVVNTFAARDLRIKSLRLRRFRTDRIGRVTLRGMRLDTQAAPNPGVGHPLGSAVLAAGGVLRTGDGATVAVPAGSIATPAAQLADETVLVSVVDPFGAVLGVGTVTLPDGSTLRLAMPASPAPDFQPGESLTVRTSDQVTDDAGRLIGTVNAVSTYRMPDKLLVYAVTETMASDLDTFLFGTPQLIQKNVVATTWEPSIYGPEGPTNQPAKLREQSDAVQGHPDKLTQQRTLTVYAYDALRLMTIQTQTTWKAEVLPPPTLPGSPPSSVFLLPGFDPATQWVSAPAPSQLIVTTYKDEGPDFYAVRVDAFVSERVQNPQTGHPTNDPGSAFRWAWQADQSSVSINSGMRPGGIRSGGASGSGAPLDNEAHVTWNDPAAITWPAPLTDQQLDARANMDGAFTYTPAAGTILLPGENQPLAVVFTPTNTAFPPVTLTVHLTVKPADVEIRWTPPGALAAGTTIDPALNATAVDATLAHAPVAGTFSYSPGPGTIIGLELVVADQGGWQPATIYATGDLVAPTAQVGGHLYVCTTAGTSGESDPFGTDAVAAGITVADGTVVWREQSDHLVITAFFTPAAITYTTKTAEREVRITPVGSALVEPEIRWTPPAIANGAAIDAALNATAVTPDPAHLLVAGTFSYAPPPGTIADAGLITASKGAWQPATVYASGDTVIPTAGGVRFRCSTAGSSGATEPVWPVTGSIADGTVIWTEQSTDVTVTVFFVPDDPLTFKSATATRQVSITGIGSAGGLTEPEIRWTPPSSIAAGTVIDAALNATAVTPDAAHLPVAGGFTYAPGPGIVASTDLVTASRGAWAAATVYASGDTVTGAGQIWRASTPGTSGGSEPAWPGAGTIVDGTVTWTEQSDTLRLTAVFLPEDRLVYKSATAERSVRIGLVGSDFLTPEIRWSPPGSLTVGDVLALEAIAVSSDDAHTTVPGTFTFSPPSGTIVSLALVEASKGARQPSTIYAAGDTVQEGSVIFACTTPGTTADDGSPLIGVTEPGAIVTDGTVTWTERSGTATLRAIFVPAPPAAGETGYKSVTAERQIRILPQPVTDPNGSDAVAQVDMVIDPDPTAPPLSYSDPNLDQATLDLLATQLVGASGVWQHEASFTGVNVPWLHRGSPMAITELHDERGAVITLPPFLVHSLELTHDESAMNVSVTRSIKALAWTPP